MGANSDIEWTDHTFNPWIGCTKVSEGCKFCYAEGESKRRGWAQWGKGKPRQRTGDAIWKYPAKWNREAIQRGRRLRVFCASLADIFDDEVDSQWRSELWDVVRDTPFLDWLILTKRPQNISKMLPPSWNEGWENACLMTSVEDQTRACRIEQLLDVPARHRALSIEPLLGPVLLEPEWMKKLDWIIVGGESQRGARPMHPDWVRSIQEQCSQHAVKFFFKQWGCWTPDEQFVGKDLSNIAYFKKGAAKPIFFSDLDKEERKRIWADRSGKTFMFRTGKAKAGNLFDGQRYHEHPFSRRISKKDILRPLTPAERKRLAVCEKAIKQGLGTFVEVGTALMEIRRAQLYRSTHPTFESYVESVLSLSRPHAYTLMDSAQVMRDLSSIEDISLPMNEAQARELRQFRTLDERVTQWRKVLAATSGGPLTAKAVREVLRTRLSAEESPKEAAATNGGEPDKRVMQCLTQLRSLMRNLPFKDKANALITELEQLACGSTSIPGVDTLGVDPQIRPDR